MPDGEGFRKPIDNRTITVAQYKEALTILLKNFCLVTVYGSGDYGDLHQRINLLPQCQVQSDYSLVVGWPAPENERLFQKFKRFSDGVLGKIDGTVNKNDDLSAEDIKTSTQNHLFVTRSIYNLYDILVALCDDIKDVRYDAEKDDITVATRREKSEILKAEQIIFGTARYMRPSNRSLN